MTIAHKIASVVDAGCGDWESTQALDWSGIDYRGYDIVGEVIAKNRKKYAAANIQFFAADILTEPLPPADLLICKHVLQHLPNRDVMKFLAAVGSGDQGRERRGRETSAERGRGQETGAERAVGKPAPSTIKTYKHVLLVNSVDADTLSAPNNDIRLGDYRPLDPTHAPFHFPGKKVLTYWDGTHMQQVVHAH